MHRIYLDELGDVQSLPLAVAATVLTIVDEAEAPRAARNLLARADEAGISSEAKRDIIDIVTSIMVYKLANLSRMEIKAMLGLNLTEEPRAIREAKEEGVLTVVTKQLARRLGQEPSGEIRSQLSTLALPVLEDLSEALLDFTSLADLETWLAENH